MTNSLEIKRQKPWQQRQLRKLRPNIVVDPRKPVLAALTIYEDMVLYTRHINRAVRQYPVAPEAIAQALSNVPQTSGLLPPNTLATGSVYGRPYFVQYLPPSMITLHTSARPYTFPLPPLVWCGCGDDYRVWALGEETYPTKDSNLYNPPFPNTYKDGRICWGSSDPRPTASAEGLPKAFQVFAESHFNLHVAGEKSVAFPVSVLALWRELDENKAEQYPLDDLRPTKYRLDWLVDGGPWKEVS